MIEQNKSITHNFDMGFRLNTKLFLLGALAFAAVTSSADTYTWTGSASAAWNKTDANWDKGVWVDGNVARFPAGASLTNSTPEAEH